MFDTIFTIVFGLVGLFIVYWFVRYVVSVMRGDYRHPQGAKRVWWIPGGGTHGGAGGQVPPFVPDDGDD